MEPTALIIVPGHAVYAGSDSSHSRVSSHWLGTFAGYQDNDEAELYYEHVRTGVLIASREQRALLIFSGGETRDVAGPFSEAQGYWFLAHQNKWFGHTEVQNRAITEEFARDSFENLLFALHRFREWTNRFPEYVAVCGFAFKAERYEFHWSTLQSRSETLKLENLGEPTFRYIPVNDPPPYLLEGPGGSREGEATTLQDWKADPLGLEGELHNKELQRNRFRRKYFYGLDR